MTTNACPRRGCTWSTVAHRDENDVARAALEMVAFALCCEGPCRPDWETGGGCEGGAKRNGTAVREKPARAPPPAPRRASERSPERASLAKRPRIPNRDSRGGECEYLDIPLFVALC